MPTLDAAELDAAMLEPTEHADIEHDLESQLSLPSAPSGTAHP